MQYFTLWAKLADYEKQRKLHLLCSWFMGAQRHDDCLGESLMLMLMRIFLCSLQGG